MLPRSLSSRTRCHRTQAVRPRIRCCRACACPSSLSAALFQPIFLRFRRSSLYFLSRFQIEFDGLCIPAYVAWKFALQALVELIEEFGVGQLFISQGFYDRPLHCLVFMLANISFPFTQWVFGKYFFF